MAGCESQMAFDQRKKHILVQLATVTKDRSPKGFPDYHVLSILDIINDFPDYVTTSSCSGRMAVYIEKSSGHQQPGPGQGDGAGQRQGQAADARAKKKGGGWLLVSHDPVEEPDCDDELMQLLFQGHCQKIADAAAVGPAQPLIYFKFEPFILHVEARTYSHARDLLSVALGCGFKHSGVVTTESRHIVHIRGNLRIDAPVAAVNGGLLVPHGYLRMCVRAANAKLGQNFAQMDRFLEAVRSFGAAASYGHSEPDDKHPGATVLQPPTISTSIGKKAKSKPPDWEEKEARRARKRAEGLREREAQACERNHGIQGSDTDGEADRLILFEQLNV